MTLNTNHEPEPEFLERLAWQTRTALRREERFARPTRGALQGASGKLRTLALIAISVLGGAATVVAAEQLQDRRERDRLVAGIELRLATAQLRFDHARVEAERTQELYRSGLVPISETLEVEANVARGQEALLALEVDRDEILATGRGPRDDLAAPVVFGRDFVRERLIRRVDTLQVQLDTARRRAEIVEAQFENGLVPTEAVQDARLPVATTEQDLRLVETRLDLRGEFLAGALTPEDVELKAARAELIARLEQGEQRLAHARTKLELVEARVQAGRVSSAEARHAQLEVAEAEAELKLSSLELAAIDDRLGR